MFKQWIGCAGGNFKTGRGGFQPEAIVIHRSGGSLADLDARCNQDQTFTSAHYGIGTDGAVHQYVDESDTAFHAGIVVNPAWQLLKPGINPNLYTIGVEFAGSAGDTPSDIQYDAAASLICDVARACQITLDASHIVLHSDIRAGRVCPGDGFDTDQLLARIRTALAQPPNPLAEDHEVSLISSANIREGAASTSARIVRVAPAGTTETITGFTDRGERVQNNSCWYRTSDGNYLWAGATDAPNPVGSAQSGSTASAPTVVPSDTAASCGIPRIDNLFAGIGSAPPVTAADTDRRVVGAIQDLLTGQGCAGLPSLMSSSYGLFGQRTGDAVQAFQAARALPPTGKVDTATLKELIANPAVDPRASQVYLALGLGFAVTAMERILSLTAQMEGIGKFAALNRNTDRAGLSFGIIQWAQRPGRLTDILVAMSAADRAQFVAIFGAGDETVADALIAHTKRLSGGVDPKTGVTVNAGFDLVNEPWLSRFRAAALIRAFQQVQVQTALRAFNSSFAQLRRYAAAVVSERGVGFMLDIANQFGDGGAKNLYQTVYQEGMNEMAVLEAVADASVARMDDSLKAGVRARRDRFLETPFLSDVVFSAGDALAAAK